MSKVKLYNHSQDSRQELEKDLSASFAMLDEMGRKSAESYFGELTSKSTELHKKNLEAQRGLYTALFKKLTSEEEQNATIPDQYKRFQEFSDFLDSKFEFNDLVDKDSRAKRDLIKYQVLSSIESNAIFKLRKNGNPAVVEAVSNYLDQANKIKSDLSEDKKLEQHEQAFKVFMKTYDTACLQFQDNINQNGKDIIDCRAQIKDSFVKLAAKDDKAVVNKIKQEEKVAGSIKLSDNIGKTSWGEWVSDIYRDMGRIIKKVMTAIMPTPAMPKTNEDAMKQFGLPPTVPKAPPIPNMPAPPMSPPPPVPTKEELAKVMSIEAIAPSSRMLTTQVDAVLARRSSNENEGHSRY